MYIKWRQDSKWWRKGIRPAKEIGTWTKTWCWELRVFFLPHVYHGEYLRCWQLRNANKYIPKKKKAKESISLFLPKDPDRGSLERQKTYTITTLLQPNTQKQHYCSSKCSIESLDFHQCQPWTSCPNSPLDLPSALGRNMFYFSTASVETNFGT